MWCCCFANCTVSREIRAALDADQRRTRRAPAHVSWLHKPATVFPVPATLELPEHSTPALHDSAGEVSMLQSPFTVFAQTFVIRCDEFPKLGRKCDDVVLDIWHARWSSIESSHRR